MRTVLSLLLMVGFVMGLSAPARACPAQADDESGYATKAVHPFIHRDHVFVDAIGHLEFPEAVILEGTPEGVKVLVRVKGQAFWLDLRGDADLLRKALVLKGKKVAVTGRLEHRPLILPIRRLASADAVDRIHLPGEAAAIVVNSLEAAPDSAEEPVVRVKIIGTLRYYELERDPPIPVWTVTVGDRTYRLEFARRGLRPVAEKLIGQSVVVTGTLRDGVVEAMDIEPARLERR